MQLLLDNTTRWNSAFTSIQRGLRMKEPLKMLLASDSDIPREDYLTDEDWDVLTEIYHGLKPFWELTQRLEGHAN